MAHKPTPRPQRASPCGCLLLWLWLAGIPVNWGWIDAKFSRGPVRLHPPPTNGGVVCRYLGTGFLAALWPLVLLADWLEQPADWLEQPAGQ